MKFLFFDAIALLGLLNAFVFAGVIFLRKPTIKANLILGFILTIFGLLCSKILLHTLNLWQTPNFRYFPLGIDLFIQPLLFLYVLSLTEPHRVDNKLLIKHLSIPFVFLLYALIIYFVTVFEYDINVKVRITNDLFYDEIKVIEDILSVISGGYYGFLAYNQLKKYKNWVETYTSDTSAPTYDWLRNLLTATAIILLFLGIMIFSQQLRFISFIPIQVFYFYLVFLIYVFGFFGFRHQEFRISLDQINRKTVALSNSELTELVIEFEHLLLKEKLFLESTLNISHCAEKLKCSVQILSEAINTSKNKNFRDYINQFRIEEFKNRIKVANLKKETIMGIAYECGFNSEASFYRIFKEKTGKTPKEFLSK